MPEENAIGVGTTQTSQQTQSTTAQVNDDFVLDFGDKGYKDISVNEQSFEAESSQSADVVANDATINNSSTEDFSIPKSTDLNFESTVNNQNFPDVSSDIPSDNKSYDDFDLNFDDNEPDSSSENEVVSDDAEFDPFKDDSENDSDSEDVSMSDGSDIISDDVSDTISDVEEQSDFVEQSESTNSEIEPISDLFASDESISEESAEDIPTDEVNSELEENSVADESSDLFDTQTENDDTEISNDEQIQTEDDSYNADESYDEKLIQDEEPDHIKSEVDSEETEPKSDNFLDIESSIDSEPTTLENSDEIQDTPSLLQEDVVDEEVFDQIESTEQPQDGQSSYDLVNDESSEEIQDVESEVSAVSDVPVVGDMSENSDFSTDFDSSIEESQTINGTDIPESTNETGAEESNFQDSNEGISFEAPESPDMQFVPEVQITPEINTFPETAPETDIVSETETTPEVSTIPEASISTEIPETLPVADSTEVPQIQPTLSLDQILDSELLSNPAFTENSTASPSNQSVLTGLFNNKKTVALVAGIGIFILVGLVAILAFPSHNSDRKEGDVVNTGIVDAEHGAAPDLFPEVNKMGNEAGNEVVSENITNNSETSSDFYEGAKSTVEFPDPMGDDDGNNLDSSDPVPYIADSTQFPLDIDESEGVEEISADDILLTISSFKTQAEVYYEYGQEMLDKQLIKLSLQIVNACENYQQQIENGQGIDQSTFDLFKSNMNGIISKINAYNDGSDASNVVVANFDSEPNFDEKEELKEYLYNR